MKKKLSNLLTSLSAIIGLLLLIVAQPEELYAQWFTFYPYVTRIDFDTSLHLNHIVNDTATSIWQIGAPSKTVFDEAATLPRAIVTDTLNPYPINDTSSFIFWHPIVLDFRNYGYIEGDYKVDTDSLNDFGKIEFSPDNGLTWILISDDTLNIGLDTWPDFGGIEGRLNLTGTSDWRHFHIFLSDSPWFYESGDTILFKFTFISDSIFDGRDGLMFDNLVLHDDQAEDIAENNKKNLNISPNPVKDFIQLSADFSMGRVEIYDLLGKQVYENNSVGSELIDVSILSPGTYIIKVSDGSKGFVSTRMFVKIE